MKKLYVFLIIFHLFLGIGAMGGGLNGILNPDSPLGVPADALKYGPFKSFLIPGLFLFFVNGVGNVIAGIFAIRHYKYQAYITGVLSGIMCMWIVIQCLILWTVNFLHYIFFFYGILGLITALIMVLKQDLFPAKIIRKCLH